MKTTQLTLAALAFFVAQGSSAYISWTGSVSANSTSTPYSTCNGSIVGPTNPTGTAPANSTTTALTTTQCSKTATIFSFVTAFPPPDPAVSTITYTDDGSATIIDADTLTPTDGTATATVTTTISTSLPGTSTITYTTTATTTIGNPSTITIPPPTGFLPVQSTLPNATYGYVDPCSFSYITATSTLTIDPGTAVFITLSGTYISVSAEHTAIPASDFTSFSISYVTSTATTTLPSATVLTPVPAEVTETVTATTSTSYAACATNNFADAIIVDNAPVHISFFEKSADQSFSGALGIYDRFDCCNYAFSQGADVWTFEAEVGCAIITGTDGVCSPATTNDTVQLPQSRGLTQFRLTVGNAQCAQWNASVFDPLS